LLSCVLLFKKDEATAEIIKTNNILIKISINDVVLSNAKEKINSITLVGDNSKSLSNDISFKPKSKRYSFVLSSMFSNITSS
jgi:hypothetical protein